jgi:hypothetical protein
MCFRSQALLVLQLSLPAAAFWYKNTWTRSWLIDRHTLVEGYQMKDFLAVALFFLLPSLGFADDFVHCEGGLTSRDQTQAVYLTDEGSRGDGTGTLQTNDGDFEFLAREDGGIYHLQAVELVPNRVLIEESVRGLPQRFAFRLNENLEVFVSCHAYDWREYCRYHTC